MNKDNTNNSFDSVGLDSFWLALRDKRMRTIRLDDRDYFSLVDLMRIFGDTTNPRRYWSDHKKRLLDGDKELYALIVQLVAQAEDRKNRTTDFAPRLVCLYVVLGMHTKSANAFRKAAAQALDSMSKVQIRYRAMNVDNGMELLADTTHEALKDSDPPDHLSAFEEMGYFE